MPQPATATGAAGGNYHSVVIDGSGNAWAWGHNSYGQLGNGTGVQSTLPVQVSGLTSVIQVAAGTFHTLALKQDGTVWSWGYNGNGQLGDGTATNRNAPVQVTGLSGVSQIAAGDTHSVAWKVDGSVWTWGANGNGQLGDGSTTSRNTPVQVTGLSGVLTIGAGGTHTLASKIDGTVWSWGSNGNGQLGDGTTTQRISPVQVVGLTGISSVTGGTAFSVALKGDGTAWSWGSNVYGQLGDGTTLQRTQPVPVAYLSGVIRLSAGQYHVLAVRNDATTWGWGADFYGELGDGEVTPALAPTQASAFNGAVAIAAARYETSIGVFADGTIRTGGYNSYGGVGDGTTLYRLDPVKVTEAGYAWKTGTPVPSVLTGAYSSNQTVTLSCATAGATIRYTTDGTEPLVSSTTYTAPLAITSTTTLNAKAWSASLAPSNVQTAVYTMTVANPSFSPVAGTYTTAQTVTLSAATAGATIRYTTDGTAPTASSTAYTAPLSVGTTTTLKVAGFKSGWTSSGTATAVYAMNFGTLAAPGMTPGAGTTAESATVTLSGPSGATIRYTTSGSEPTATSPAYVTPLVLTATTTLKAKSFKVDWTLSATTSNVYTIQVAAPTLSLASGPYPAGQTLTLNCTTPGATIHYSLDGADPTQTYPYVASGGTILVGNYTLKAKAWAAGLAPSAVTSASYTMTGVAGGMVAASTAHSLVMKTDATVWSWGSNLYGQLGDGTTTTRSTPVAVAGLTGVAAIAAGSFHSLAVTSSGSVWSWGSNSYGQLGDGTVTQRTSPVQVSGLSGIVAVAAGQYHSLGLKSDGSVWAWGYNNYGQLGDGSNTQRTTPVQVASLTGATLIATGANHSLARKSDGTLWSWGYNGNGQLGDNTLVSKNSPVQVSGLTSVAAAGGGPYDSLAAKTDGTAWAWGATSGSKVPLAQSGLTGATAMKAGVYHFVALESNWYVWAWGQNSYGQLGNGTTTGSSTPVWVNGLPQIISIGSGDNHNVALGQDGSVWSWGLNASSQLGDGTTVSRSSPVKVAEPGFAWKAGTPVISPAPGPYTSSQSVTMTTATAGATIHYTTDGSTPTTGSPVYSAAVPVTATTTVKAKAVKSGLADSNVTLGVYSLKIATPGMSPLGGNFSTAQNAVISCSVPGATIRYTTTGLDPTTSDPTIASGGTVVVNKSLTLKARAWLSGWTTSDVVAGTFTLKPATPSLNPGGGVFTAAQTVTISAATAGSVIRYSMSGLEPTAMDPVVVSGGTVSVGSSATLKAKAFISGWTPSDTGSASYVLNLAAAATPTFTPAPGTYAAIQSVALASSTPGAVIRYTLDGADPSAGSPLFASPITIAGTTTIKAVAYASDRAASGVASGTYQINLGAVETPTLSVASGFYVTSRTLTIGCGTAGATIRYTTNGSDPTASDTTIASGGTLFVDRAMIVKAAAWKSGLPQSAVARRDYVVTGMVAAGGQTTLALKSEGTVWSWGNNGNGQLADNPWTTPSRTTPAQVAGLSGVVAIAEGSFHSLAVKADGSVWSWGHNGYGQLGDGTTTQRITPVQVTGLANVVAVAAGQYHSLALRNDGGVWSWGSNGNGQLGDGTTTQRTTPVQVTSLTSVVALAAGQSHSLAAKTDGTVRSWGYNQNGQLGDGTTTQRLTPVAVSNLSGVSRVAAGAAFSVALRTDGLSAGTLWSWGLNDVGQLGDGSILQRTSPVKSAANATATATGGRHALAPGLDGRTLAWGVNDASQLGIPGSTPRPFPFPTASLSEIVHITAGSDHSAALRADGSIWTWGANGTGQCGIGSQVPTLATPTKVTALSLASNGWMTQDPDQDALSNAAEYRLGTDPLNPDTNQDGLKDGVAVATGKSATSADADGDGLLNGKELQIGTNPLLADTDGDGALDGADCAPLDPNRWQCTPNPSDTTPPVVALSEPPNAVLLP